jgi:alpha-amylase
VRATNDSALHGDWRRLTTSDHLYYMCTKWFSDGDVHKYFSPFQSPHDAYVAFMNVLDDVDRRARRQAEREREEAEIAVPVAAGQVAG